MDTAKIAAIRAAQRGTHHAEWIGEVHRHAVPYPCLPRCLHHLPGRSRIRPRRCLRRQLREQRQDATRQARRSVHWESNGTVGRRVQHVLVHERIVGLHGKGVRATGRGSERMRSGNVAQGGRRMQHVLVQRKRSMAVHALGVSASSARLRRRNDQVRRMQQLHVQRRRLGLHEHVLPAASTAASTAAMCER